MAKANNMNMGIVLPTHRSETCLGTTDASLTITTQDKSKGVAGWGSVLQTGNDGAFTTVASFT